MSKGEKILSIINIILNVVITVITLNKLLNKTK